MSIDNSTTIITEEKKEEIIGLDIPLENSTSIPSSPPVKHLFLLVHGLQGYALDFQKITPQLISQFNKFTPNHNHSENSLEIVGSDLKLLLIQNCWYYDDDDGELLLLHVNLKDWM